MWRASFAFDFEADTCTMSVHGPAFIGKVLNKLQVADKVSPVNASRFMLSARDGEVAAAAWSRLFDGELVVTVGESRWVWLNEEAPSKANTLRKVIGSPNFNPLFDTSNGGAA